VAYDGQIGERLALKGEYDVILLDVILPYKNGYEICKSIREKNQKVPILMLTALDTTDDKVTGFDAGVDDYLVKPFDLTELSARVLAVSRRYAGNPNPRVAFGDIEIDKAERRAWRGGQPVDLTRREWAIMDLLTRRATAVVSKEQIEEALYAFGSEIESNSVEVHISRLRKKLGREVIQTQRGVGYRLSRQ